MLRKKLVKALLFFCIVLLLSSNLNSENRNYFIKSISLKNNRYLSFNDMVSVFKFGYTFDVIIQRGAFFFKNHYAILNVGLSVVVIDGKLFKSMIKVKRNNGDVLIPYDLAKSIVENFHPLAKITENKSKNLITISLDNKKSNSKIKKNKIKNKYINYNNEKISFIVIDAGHGGKDPGALGSKSFKEKKITLKVARRLGVILKKKLKGIKIRYTRYNDKYVSLQKRTEIANRLLKKNENGLFLSIHVNASISSRISGFETYFLSQNASNEEARNTAALENDVVVLENHKANSSYGDVDYIEAMMLTSQIQKESSILADSILKGMIRKNKIFKSRGVRKADFFVLRGVLMPATLVEIGFITNKKESKYLKRESHLKNISYGIADGVIMFIKRYNKMISK